MSKTTLLMTLGYLCLAAGIVCYGLLALASSKPHPALLPTSFFLIMGSLLFFNLPALLARRRDRQRSQGKSNTTQGSNEIPRNRQHSFLGKPDIMVNRPRNGRLMGIHGRNFR